jgi:5-formyltetrahydrofolate cyclo-ligase
MSISVDQLRQKIRHRRRQLGVGVQLYAANQLCSLVSALDIYRQSQNIALYLAADGEIDCRYLIKRIWRDGKRCFLPVVNGASTTLSFLRYTPASQLKANRYQLLEPVGGALIKSSDLDLVVTPLVAFDTQGNRVGMGAGYYDRTFAFAQQQNSPYLLGVAHACQKLGRIDAQPWDVTMDKVIWV